MRQVKHTTALPAIRKRRSAAGRVLASLFFVFLLAGMAAAVVAFYGYQSYAIPGPLAANKAVDIEKGLRTPEIAKKLEKEGVIADARIFAAMAFVTGARGRLKFGEYEFPAGASMEEVTNLIMSGKSITYKVSIPEGWTSEMALERVLATPELTGEVTTPPPEGSLMPDTYVFKRGMTRQQLIADMQAAQQKLLDEVWQKRRGSIFVKTKEEALVLASIVEKETGTPEERPLVASVFMNRLKDNMRLQSDPTIIYGIVGGKGKLDRPLSKADITTPTPYNTYTIKGLPPGPIANPGRAALEAVVAPPDTGYLYFVADGSGGHAFASTLDEHNRNVAKWRALAGNQVSASAEAEPPVEPPPAPETVATELPPIEQPAPVAETPQVTAADIPKPDSTEPVAAVVEETVEAAPPRDPELKPGSVITLAGKLVPIPKRKPRR